MTSNQKIIITFSAVFLFAVLSVHGFGANKQPIRGVENILRVPNTSLAFAMGNAQEYGEGEVEPPLDSAQGVILALLLAIVLLGLLFARQRRRVNWLEAERTAWQSTDSNDDAMGLGREVRALRKELEQAREQLVSQERMASMGTLAAGIAHEIRNPLNFICSFAELTKSLLAEMADQKDTNLSPESVELLEDITGNLQRILQNAERVDRVVKDMLLHSRDRANQRELTDLNALVKEYTELTWHGMRVRETDFHVDIQQNLAPNLPPVMVAPRELGRVLINILGNACYAVKSKTDSQEDFRAQLKITTSAGIGETLIQIRDNGTGISREALDKIFEPFYTTKPIGEGTGLGLAISHEIIVDQYGGHIDVESREGEYTQFTIGLPV